MRYKGVNIKIISVRYKFKHISFKYGSNLIIYIDKETSSKHKSKLLHKALKELKRNN